MLFNKSEKDIQKKEDQELLELYRKTGDLEHLGSLFDRYIHLVYGLCLKYLKHREEAQDAVMQIFEKLIDEVLRHEVSSFKSWLYVLSKNYCLMHLRTLKSKDAKYADFKKDHTQDMESVVLMHHNSDTDLESDLDALRKCIEQLKEEQQACVKLFFLEEKSYQQIVDILKVDLKKVKSSIQNGRRNLKICLENKNG